MARSISMTCLLLSGVSQACDVDGSGYIGSVCWTANNFCPRGFLLANGALLPITQNSALFSVIGTRFGGDGRTTFKLPDLNEREAVGAGPGPGLSNVQLGQLLGSPTSPPVLPPHNHQLTTGPVNWHVGVHNADGDDKPATGGTWSSLDSTDYHFYADSLNNPPATLKEGIVAAVLLDEHDKAVNSLSTTYSGDGQNFGILGPQLTVTACINNSGLFPPRN
ncbi:MAG: tail fiber protein [Cellvibrionales bacterium]|nr:tail fiber protein [Cellvibrionales bacterium]